MVKMKKVKNTLKLEKSLGSIKRDLKWNCYSIFTINTDVDVFVDVSEEITLEEEGLSEKEKHVEEEKDVISDEEVLLSKYGKVKPV